MRSVRVNKLNRKSVEINIGVDIVIENNLIKLLENVKVNKSWRALNEKENREYNKFLSWFE